MEKFINKEVSLVVSDRNHLFIKSTVKSHPWMNESCICQTFKISPKTLRGAIDGGYIETRNVGKRREVFAADVFSVCRVFEDTLGLKKASKYIGISTEELTIFQSTGVFKKVLKPDNERFKSYRFSVSEMVRLKRKLQRRNLVSS